ncbi:MAG TPA: TMEM175 family protein [Chitinophagaceae bacterium]|nr:TMEM175 family protein [Chitinophagaceae bacterium]
MATNLHNELRKEFQLERMILFSDAVFAIAITLLVIEIKIPEIPRNEVTDHILLHRLAELIPKFVGFLVSFLLIGQYWIVHHRMFGYVINFSQRLIWLNILFLLGIALMPFSTGFYSEYAGVPVITPVIFYTGNIALMGTVNFCMWQYISNPKRKLTENLSPLLAKYSSLRSLLVTAVFVIFSFVYLLSPYIAAFIPTSIPLILRFAFGGIKKKLNEQSKKE